MAEKNAKSKAITGRNFKKLLEEKMAELEKEYQEEKRRLEEEIENLEKQLSDLEREREEERKILEKQIAELKHMLQRYAIAYQELEQEFKRVTSPPLGYGYVVSVINPTARTAEIISQDGGRYRIFVAKTVDLSKLKRGQPVLLNQAFHIIDLGLKEVRGHLAIVRQIEGEYAIVGRDVGGEATALISEGLKLEPGDQVIVDRAYAVILAKIEKEEQYEELLVKQVDPITFEDVGGLEKEIRTLKEELIWPYAHPDWYKEFEDRPSKGILLVGAPGVGKTMLVKALFNYLKDHSLELFGKKKEVVLLHVAGPELQSWWVGMTEYMIRKLFKVARKEAAKGKISIIFFDEAESMFSVRTHGVVNTYKNDYVTQFTAEMQGLETNPNEIVVVILASNRGELLDPAVIRAGRIDVKIDIPRPNKEATSEIFGKYIKTKFTFDKKYFEGFVDENSQQIKFETPEEVRNYLVNSITEYLFTNEEKFRIITFRLKNGETKTLSFKDVLSGAIIEGIAREAKALIRRKRKQTNDFSLGFSLEILKEATDEKFKQEKAVVERLINAGEWQTILAILGIKGTDIDSIESSDGKQIDYGMMS